MSKCKQIKGIIEDVFRDGEIHTVEEVKILAMKKKIIIDKDDAAIKNAFYQTKRDNINFINVGVGKYQMKQKNEEERNLDMEKLDKSIECILNEIEGLKHFDWVNCSNEELLQAREKVAKVKKMDLEVHGFIR